MRRRGKLAWVLSEQHGVTIVTFQHDAPVNVSAKETAEFWTLRRSGHAFEWEHNASKRKVHANTS